MITENLTKEFIDKHYFVLDKPYCVEEYDADGFSTDKYMNIEPGTEWQVTDEMYIGGEIHLDGLTDGCGWLEISKETFREYFSAHEWQRRKKRLAVKKFVSSKNREYINVNKIRKETEFHGLNLQGSE